MNMTPRETVKDGVRCIERPLAARFATFRDAQPYLDSQRAIGGRDREYRIAGDVGDYHIIERVKRDA